MAIILDGKALSQKMRLNIKDNVSNLYKKGYDDCCLAVIIVGENPASKVYVKNKIIACEQTNIKSVLVELPAESSQEQIEEQVKKLADDKDITGILVQLPLPKGIDEGKILSLIPKEKDVDGFTESNVSAVFKGEEGLYSCTPHGIIKLLKEYGVDLCGKNAVVIGRSNIVGKPMAHLLLKENCTVTVCHSKTKDIEFFTKNADIIVVAIGKKGFLTADMVSDGCVVVDVGINRVDGKLYGDVDFDAVSEKASYITPVPGGVGPMTVTMLMYNTYLAYLRKINDGIQR